MKENFGHPLKVTKIFHCVVTLTTSWKISAMEGGGVNTIMDWTF